MSEFDQLKKGAEILQQVDVTEIITSLATGIADAQKKLDNNSIQQAIALADPSNGIGGKSLVQMGFSPAFYHFQHADVSAEIDLKMRLKTDFELNVNLYGHYSKQGGFSKDKMDFLREDHESSTRKEYKSSKSFTTTSNNYEELTIDNETVQIDQSLESIHRMDKFENDIRTVTGIDSVVTKIDASSTDIQVHEDSTAIVSYLDGYLVVNLPQSPTINEGILKVADYEPSPAVDVDFTADGTAEFTIGAGDEDTFEKVFAAVEADIAGGTLVAFKGASLYTAATASEPLSLHFDYNKKDAALALDKNLTDGGITKENRVMKGYFRKLVKVLTNDSSARIRLMGNTDGSGPTSGNLDLSRDRAQSLESWFISQGVKKSQIEVKWQGEALAVDGQKDLNHRNVTVEIISGSDYFFIESTAIEDTAVPLIATSSDAGFIYVKETGTPAPAKQVVIIFNGTTYTLGSLNTVTDFVTSFNNETALSESFSLSVIENTAYALHNEATVKYTMYSSTKEDITLKRGSSQTEDFNSSDTKYMKDETITKKKLLKKDVEKLENPSSVAVGGSIDLRTARQFEMEVKGNSKVSARLVSLPAPPEFLDEIKDYFNN